MEHEILLFFQVQIMMANTLVRMGLRFFALFMRKTYENNLFTIIEL